MTGRAGRGVSKALKAFRAAFFAYTSVLIEARRTGEGASRVKEDEIGLTGGAGGGTTRAGAAVSQCIAFSA